MSENSVKIAVCVEEDCPLHPSNKFRLDIEGRLPDIIDSFENKSFNFKNMVNLNEMFMMKYEYQGIPSLCSFCSFKQDKDIKSEVIAFIAKRNLTDE